MVNRIRKRERAREGVKEIPALKPGHSVDHGLGCNGMLVASGRGGGRGREEEEGDRPLIRHLKESVGEVGEERKRVSFSSQPVHGAPNSADRKPDYLALIAVEMINAVGKPATEETGVGESEGAQLLVRDGDGEDAAESR